MAKSSEIIPVERIQKCILLIRNHKVILDRDMAALYGVETRDLNKAVTRNIERFPKDFMFRLNKREFENLKFHFGTSSWGGTRKLPRAFTEQGVAMLSSVLRSERAVAVNIAIMRTFVKLREILGSNELLRHKIESMERKYDKQFKVVFEVLGEMLAEPEKPEEPFGFHARKISKKKASRKKTKK
ncbi:MAG: ORF6N domain-containing protein [Planctomycetes bacterium]|nr:ORF6N domain-containing protein [Planctomycetota bacterium]